ncbi:unnamed protein product [Leuciscus chuanchicus]
MDSLIFPILFIFAEGVFGFETDGVKSVSVKEGDSVTLNTCLNQMQKSNKILWMFENAVIANIKDQKLSTEDGPDGRFRDRLELDFESGSLTIRNIRSNHSGLYQVDMFSTSKSSKKFNVTVTGVFDPDADQIKAVSAMEGKSVTLNTDIKLQKDDLMLWRFAKATKGNPVHHNPCQSDATAIAKIYGETREISLDPGDSDIFNNIVKVDKLSGSLTITSIRPEHSGIYILQISDNTGTKCRRFRITVSDAAKSYLCVVWMSIALVLIVILTVGCLAAGILYRKDLFTTVRRNICCQPEKAQDSGLLVHGVFVAVTDEVKPVSVMKGDSVTLNTGVSELQSDDTIEWIFGDKLIIAKISKNKISINVFKDRLELDSQNGSLTIKDITNEHEGLYKVDIGGRYLTSKSFNVTVREGMMNVSVMEGESVTLRTGVIEIQGHDLILWKFEDQLIAEINKGTNQFILNDSGDVRFKDRLQPNEKTGSLIISKSRITDTGVYHLHMINSTYTIQRIISVTVSGE